MVPAGHGTKWVLIICVDLATPPPWVIPRQTGLAACLRADNTAAWYSEETEFVCSAIADVPGKSLDVIPRSDGVLER